MPSYDLVCKECGDKFNVICSISQKDKQGCPKCGSYQIEQRFTSVNIGGKSAGKEQGFSGRSNGAPRSMG